MGKWRTLYVDILLLLSILLRNRTLVLPSDDISVESCILPLRWILLHTILFLIPENIVLMEEIRGLRLKYGRQNSWKLSLFSPDGENGFPGNLQVHVIFVVTNDNELDIHYEAETDKPTVINLSHHSFFNISGDFDTTVEDQSLYINADMYTPYDSLKCVTGEILPVAGTPFDFTTPHLIGERINENVMQLNIVKGYDHNWVLNTNGDDTKLAARLIDTKSGRSMEVYTTEPGLQVYTANGLRGAMVGKKGIAYQKRTAVCLETQHFTDSPNKPQFPSTVLRPGEKYYSHCVYRFGVVD